MIPGALVAFTLFLQAAPDEGVFDPAPVHRYRIEIPEEGLASLRQDPRTYVRATFREGDAVFTDVGIRLKGGAGSFRNLGQKPAFTIKFDKFVPRQRYRGLQKVSLNNAVQDPTYLSDLIANELFRAAGLPAPRIGHARVELNGEDQGLYVVLEAITREFLGRFFKDRSGNLYKGPGDVDSEDLYVDPHSASLDRADLKELVAAASEPDHDRRRERLGEILALDRFATFLALETIHWHWDGYSMAVNNYAIYRDPTSKKFVFFPRDQDQIFGEPGGSIWPPLAGLVAKAFRGTSWGRRAYRERLEELTETVFDPDAIARRLEGLCAKINPVIAERDPEEAAAHREVVGGFIERIRERAKSIREQIRMPEPQPPAPLAFEGGRARVFGWESRTAEGEPEFARCEGERGPLLRISIPKGGNGCGSYRASVVLPAGRYRFAGLVKTKGVKAAGASEDGSQPPSGAGLRISGRQPERKLLGDRDWTRVEFDFTVEETETWDEGPPVGRVELVCELRAARGTAWFDEGSLELIRLADREATEAEARARHKGRGRLSRRWSSSRGDPVMNRILAFPVFLSLSCSIGTTAETRAAATLLSSTRSGEDDRADARAESEPGRLPQLSQGLHGYIGFSHEEPPPGSAYNVGMGFYAAVWSLIEQPLADFQIGLPSSWITPDNSDNTDKPLAPEGTLARTWRERGPTWSSVFQTVEGGLGYWAGNHFRYGPPKFSMNATPQCYDYEVGSPGWSFFYSNEALPDDRLAIAQLSNRLLIPPDGLPFQGNPDGQFLGYTWMALPFTDPTDGEPPTGEQSWTCFLSAENFKGPIAYYIPETWSKIGKLFNYPFLYGRGLDARPGIMGGGAMEINTVPRFDGRDARGVVYSKIPKLRFPVDAQGRTFLVQEVTYYSKAALYDAFKGWRKGGPPCSGRFDERGAWKPKLTTRTTRYDQAGKRLTGAERVFDTRVFEGNVWGLQWFESDVSAKGLFPQYSKDVGKERVVVSPSDVPAETGLLTQEFRLARGGAPYTSPTAGAWIRPGPKSGPFTARLADGSVVTYFWYRFIDQPSFQQYAWSEKKKAELQAFVEKLHATWPMDRDYMPPPSRGRLAALDPALIVTPPPGLEVGYVPIVTHQAAR